MGDRWTLLLVAALLDGPRRFRELEESVPGIATNVLTSRLRDLERDGLVRPVPYSRRPLRVDYHLTDQGAALADALRLLAAWGTVTDEHTAPRHPACGTPMEVRYWCPTCARLEDDDDDIHV